MGEDTTTTGRDGAEAADEPDEESRSPDLSDVPDWDDEYLDRVGDRLLSSFDLERDYAVRGEQFPMYGEMRIVNQKHFFHPALSYGEHEASEHLFVRRTDSVSVADLERLVDLGHDLADDWIEADEEHFSTRFSFAVVVEEIPADVRSFVAGFRDRTMLKKGYYGHYEIHLVVVDPAREDIVASKKASLEEGFRTWKPLEEEEITWLDLLRRRLQL